MATKIENKKEKKKLTKEMFLQELEIVKEKLPSNYGVIIKHFFPTLDTRQVYNVVNYKIHNEKVLQALKFIVPSEN
jgi:hypothetical protein